MKKIIVLISIIVCLCFCACTPINTSVYNCTITYTLGDNQYTETIMMDVPSMYVPAYSCGNKKIKVLGVGSDDYQFSYKTVYSGELPIAVQSFDYTLVRTYRASRLNGRELKNK